LCHRVSFGDYARWGPLCIALENGKEEQEETKKRKKTTGIEVSEKGENRKGEDDNAVNSRCLFPLSLSLPSPLFRDLIQRDHLATHSVAFVLSRSPSGEHELPYSAATYKDQLKQITSIGSRAAVA